MSSFSWPPKGGGGGGVSGVTSLNGLTGALSLVAGSNITITPSGSTITIAASGGGDLSQGSGVQAGYVGFFDDPVNKTLLGSSAFNFDLNNNLLGVGVAADSVLAGVHAGGSSKSAPSTGTVTGSINLWVPPENTTFTITQTTPDVGLPSISAIPSASGGAYSADAVVDYIVVPNAQVGSGGVWGVADGIATSITSASPFHVSITIGEAQAGNYTPNIWVIARSVNGGGYNDYQILVAPTVSITDNNSGWTSGSYLDVISPLADDFLANGSTQDVTGYGTKTATSGTVVISDAGYNPGFTDDNSGTAYKMEVVFTSGADLPYRLDWPAARNYDASGDFTSGPVGPTQSGTAVTTPMVYGFREIDIGVPSLDYSYYATFNFVGVRTYSPSPFSISFPFPTSTDFYYVEFDTFANNDGKIIRNRDNTAKIITNADVPLFDDAVETYPDDTTVGPTNSPLPANISEGANPQHVIKDTGGSGAESLWTDTNFVPFGSILGSYDGNVPQIRFGYDADANLLITAPPAAPKEAHLKAAALFLDANDGSGTGVGSLTNDGVVAATWSQSGGFQANTLAIGFGSVITKLISATATINFNSINPGDGDQQTMTVTGAQIGDTVILGYPNNLDLGIVVFAFVNSTDTVYLRAQNVKSSGGPINPEPGDYTATIIRF